MSPFRPVGDRARWRILHELLRGARVGEVVTYEEMAEALELSPDDERSKVQLAVRRAVKELEVEDLRTVEVVPNKGYRIVEPERHLDLARKHQRKASRALVRGQSKVVHVDYNGMAPEVRRACEGLAAVFAAQLDFNRRIMDRQDDLEQAVRAATERVDEEHHRTEEELAVLRERLARLEGKTSGSE